MSNFIFGRTIDGQAPHTGEVFTRDGAMHVAKTIFETKRETVYVLELRPVRRPIGVYGARGWRWIQACPKCKADPVKCGSCPRCKVARYVEVEPL